MHVCWEWCFCLNINVDTYCSALPSAHKSALLTASSGNALPIDLSSLLASLMAVSWYWEDCHSLIVTCYLILCHEVDLKTRKQHLVSFSVYNTTFLGLKTSDTKSNLPRREPGCCDSLPFAAKDLHFDALRSLSVQKYNNCVDNEIQCVFGIAVSLGNDLVRWEWRQFMHLWGKSLPVFVWLCTLVYMA